MSISNIHHSTCSVIPKHILRNVAEHGDDEARETVAETLVHTARIARERAATPATLIETPHAPGARRKQRVVYDAHGESSTLAAELVANEETRHIRDVEAKEAFDGAGAVYDFLAKVFNRNSIDNRGMTLTSTVHYGRHFANAMWNGREVVYGDGDGKLIMRLTADVAVIGHEFGHGVTQHDAALEYHGQSGALNEHLSDVIGIMIKQRWLAQTAAHAAWLIGEGLLGPTVQGKAIRSMRAPGTAYDDPILGRDPQPAHMRDYVYSADDDGGVHINSGILNFAFYLTATALGGYSWLTPGGIWLRAARTRLYPQAGFQDFANATVIAAGELHGVGSRVQSTVAAAMDAVGLPVPAALPKGRAATPMRAQKRRNRW